MVLGLPFLRCDIDVVQTVHDDHFWAASIAATVTVVHKDFECVFPGLIGGGKTYTGTDGMRTAFADWLSPWATYRNEVEEAVDYGDRVLVLYNVFGRLKGSTAEVALKGGDIYTLRDGKIARIEFCTRAQALRIMGATD